MHIKTFLLITTIILSSCSNSMKSDARKMAELQCEGIKITMGAAGDIMSRNNGIEKVRAHQKEIQAFSLKMAGKYKDPAKMQEFTNKVQTLAKENCLGQ